jgi:hypothetical protein
VDLGKRKAAIFLQNRGCEMVAGDILEAIVVEKLRI